MRTFITFITATIIIIPLLIIAGFCLELLAYPDPDGRRRRRARRAARADFREMRSAFVRLKDETLRKDGLIGEKDAEIRRLNDAVSAYETEVERLNNLLTEQYRRYHSGDNNMKMTDL